MTEMASYTVNREEVAWAAGLFEGEGTIGNWKNGTGRQVVARIVMTDEDVLDRFAAAIAPIPVKVTGPLGPYGTEKKPRFSVATTSFENTQAVVAMLWPWLAGRRREQARLALRGPDRPRVMTHCHEGHPYGRDARGRKVCHTCKSAYDRERYRLRKQGD